MGLFYRPGGPLGSRKCPWRASLRVGGSIPNVGLRRGEGNGERLSTEALGVMKWAMGTKEMGHSPPPPLQFDTQRLLVRSEANG